MGLCQYDVIIIGSGISGMTAGIIAAKEGEKALVLEQHSIPGGLRSIKEKAGCFPQGSTGWDLWMKDNLCGIILTIWRFWIS
ncbi:MAG: FAD-dependent oxidoreductase [Proteobacteria bacterium]|nr:FAD-dependent oxidoreductase [Pseudomonadota bacterium]MBU4472065.1 FAD-dependent oxidoreductase [Pseudomonadota bacterium]MCG2752937.1 FAD-dependent oxidoreductase [Desulfobacteraceae bacterium]